MGTTEHSEHIQARYFCVDCGGPKSTEKTIRCWDCSLLVKHKNWQQDKEHRATQIMNERKNGMTMVEIAAKLGISRQRVYQIVHSAGLKVSEPKHYKKESHNG
jgi:DNA-directed RNA polymerase subunit RPC12/RpoP